MCVHMCVHNQEKIKPIFSSCNISFKDRVGAQAEENRLKMLGNINYTYVMNYF